VIRSLRIIFRYLRSTIRTGSRELPAQRWWSDNWGVVGAGPAIEAGQFSVSPSLRGELFFGKPRSPP
jgi:hypothetical protein